MKEIFAEFYNKIMDFFSKTEEADRTKDVARNRLKLVLMQDRTNLNPRLLERLRGEMIDLLSKYVVMDKELLELNFTPEDDQLALMLSIPVIRAKEEDEIEEAIKAEDAEKERLAQLIEKAESIEDEDEDEDDNSDEETEEELDESETEEENDDETSEIEEETTSDDAPVEKPKKKKKNKKKKKIVAETETKTEEPKNSENVEESVESEATSENSDENSDETSETKEETEE